MFNRKSNFKTCGSKHTLGDPINYRTLNSSSNSAELKHTLMHKCTNFSASRLFHRFLMSARSGSTRRHNTLSNEISLARTSVYLDGLMQSMHSIFGGSLNLSQELGHPNPYQTLLQCGNLHCLITLVGNVGECTLSYCFAEVYAALLLCWAIPNIITLLRYTLSFYFAELFLIL